MTAYVAYSDPQPSRYTSMKAKLWEPTSKTASTIVAYGSGGQMTQTKTKTKTKTKQYRWQAQVILKNPSELREKVVLRRRTSQEQQHDRALNHHDVFVLDGQSQRPSLATTTTMTGIEEEGLAFTAALAASLPPFFFEDYPQSSSLSSDAVETTRPSPPDTVLEKQTLTPVMPTTTTGTAATPQEARKLMQQLMSETELCMAAYQSATPTSPHPVQVENVPRWAEQIMSWREIDEMDYR